LLKSALYQLEKLIGEVLENNRTSNDPDNLKRLPEQVKSVQTLSAEIKEKWVHELFSPAKEQVITRYVHYHQAGITQLSDQISGKIPEKPNSLFHHYEELLNELEQLLSFLKNQCYRYFDLDYKVTIHQCQKQRAKINEFSQELTEYSNSEIDITLIEVIAVSIRELTAEASHSGISYRQTEHVFNLLRMVHQLTHVIKGMITNDLAEALYRQNLNTLRFLNWYQAYLLNQIDQMPLNKDRENFIIDQVKTLSGIFVDPEKAFEPELPAVSVVLLPWLHRMSGYDHNTGRLPDKQDILLQMSLNLSVPQFAMFVRIFSQAGCFPETNVSQITRFFTQYFTTKKQIHISRESFRKAFYSLDQASAAIVRDYLQKMINYLNKTYFP